MKKLIFITFAFLTSITTVKAQTDSDKSNLSSLEVKVMLDKEFYLSGSTINAEILLLGCIDENIIDVVINGQIIKMQNGKAFYKKPVSGEGKKIIRGYIKYYVGNTSKILTFEKEYSVFKSAAIINPDSYLFNTLYLGIENPISIQVPGFSPNDIVVTSNQVSLEKIGNYLYFAKATLEGEVIIETAIRMGDSSLMRMGSAMFKVKKLPRLELSLDNIESGSMLDISQTKNFLTEKTKLLILNDDEFPIKKAEAKLEGFTFSILKKKGENPKSIEVKGLNLTDKCIALLSNISSGDKIIIDSVKIDAIVKGLKAYPLVITAK